MQSTEFTLMRHARTHWNLEHRIQGQTDTILAPEGQKQAEAWANALRPGRYDRILASDLRRAVATAEAIRRRVGGALDFDSRLREQDWGEWVGLTLCRIVNDHRKEFQSQSRRGWDFTPPGGESRSRVLQRASEALRDAAERFSGQRILVVTHQGVIKCLLYHLVGHDMLPGGKKPLERDRLHRLRLDEDGFSLVSLNKEFVP
ncbi:histidine phosphatase family protein [Desulfohalovibrio reitneri]|uniref:histidine phosphatase family protein n=1 Tax=Desulfohalovibrio reitneri TaxID=1307759 RepID=UPI0005596890|nr:histidine phosphatase family protein [Desulfohalovibrio reitneri]